MISDLFSVCYLGPVDYWAAWVQSSQPQLESQENYRKQTYRNRCYIDGPNGVQMLHFPVRHQAVKQIDTVELSLAKPWPQQHWQALQSTYGNSPFFDGLADDLAPLYRDPPRRLWEFNLALHRLILRWLRLPQDFSVNRTWQEKTTARDWREAFHPKRPSVSSQPIPYRQAFADRFGFRAKLSVLDLLCNEGPAAYDLLRETEFVFSQGSNAL